MRVFTVYFDTPDAANDYRTWTVGSVHVRAYDQEDARETFSKWNKSNPSDTRKFREARELVCINDVEAVQCGAV